MQNHPHIPLPNHSNNLEKHIIHLARFAKQLARKPPQFAFCIYLQQLAPGSELRTIPATLLHTQLTRSNFELISCKVDEAFAGTVPQTAQQSHLVIKETLSLLNCVLHCGLLCCGIDCS